MYPPGLTGVKEANRRVSDHMYIALVTDVYSSGLTSVNEANRGVSDHMYITLVTVCIILG